MFRGKIEGQNEEINLFFFKFAATLSVYEVYMHIMIDV